MAIPYWRLSGFYFCYFATLGAFLPFWSLYLKQVGFSAGQIGELTALLVATKIIAPNLWGWLADKTGRRLALIRSSCLMSMLMFCGFLWAHSYSWFATVTVAFSLFWNASLPQFEAATLFHLKTQPHRYSQVRLWGSVGFILAVLGIGWLVDRFNITSLPWIITGLLACNWLCALIIPEASACSSASAPSGLWSLLLKAEVLAFFGVYMLLQISHGAYYVFYSVYLKQHGYSASLTGGLWALGVAAEIVLFMGARRLLKLFSLRGMLLLSMALSMWRWWLIAYLVDNLAWVVFAQCLHAASFGLAHVVAMHLLHDYFGEHHQGKAQALYSSLSFGLGGMFGSLYSGYFWDSLGPSAVYVIAALASGIALLIAFVGVGRPKIPTLS